MPPKLRALTHRTKLSWHSAPRRSCTVDRRKSEEFFRRQLEEFRQYVREHYIAEFGAGHKVLAKGKHSRQFQQTSLRSLLSLEVIPDHIKIPCQSIPHRARTAQPIAIHATCGFPSSYTSRQSSDAGVVHHETKGTPGRPASVPTTFLLTPKPTTPVTTAIIHGITDR
jgi:hypothetical protein